MIDKILDFFIDHLVSMFIIITIVVITFIFILHKSGYDFTFRDFCKEKGGHWKTFDSSGFSMSGHYIISDTKLCLKDGKIIEDAE